MDAFRTADETIFRRKARDYFRLQDDPPRSMARAAPERIWRDLEGARCPDGAAASPSGVSLSERVSIAARSLLGEPWVKENLPVKDFPSENERKRR